MALLNPVDQVVVHTSRPALRLNWRLLVALGGVFAFWSALGEGVARMLHG